MTPRIFAYVGQKGGVLADTAPELITAAKNIHSTAHITAILTGCGPELDAACSSASELYAEVWRVEHQELAYANAELVRQALVAILPRGCILLVAHDHFGIDLSPGLSIKVDAVFVPDLVNIEALRATSLKVVRQEFGGQVSAHVLCDVSAGAVLNVRPGAFKTEEAASRKGTVVDKSGELGQLKAKRRFLESVAADSEGVDISKEPVLVSVGRGIQERDNIAIAEELAEVMGAAVSCSRPVVDAKWLEKSRQVGSSGKTVRPKVYLACGISGSFQHLAGIKGKPFFVAINKNPKAPIFQVADVGIVDDLLEFIPELTERIRESVLSTR